MTDRLAQIQAGPPANPIPPGHPDDDPAWRAATWAVMRDMGYTDEEIRFSEAQTTHSSLCEFDGHGWECEDEYGVSNHPIRDVMDEVSGILEIGLASVLAMVRELHGRVDNVTELLRHAEWLSEANGTGKRFAVVSVDHLRAAITATEGPK